MSFDPTNEHTFATLAAPVSRATNNAATAGFDTKGYEGAMAVRVSFGIQTAGDNGTFTVQMQSSATNSAAAATNIAGASVVSTANNTASSGTTAIDTRACLRYLFARVIIAGANSPATPIGIELIGTKQTEP